MCVVPFDAPRTAVLAKHCNFEPKFVAIRTNHLRYLKRRWWIRITSGISDAEESACNQLNIQVFKPELQTSLDSSRLRNRLRTILSDLTKKHYDLLFEGLCFEAAAHCAQLSGSQLTKSARINQPACSNRSQSINSNPQLTVAQFASNHLLSWSLQNKVCHRDLKLENILLDDKGNAKVRFALLESELVQTL